MTVVNTMIVGSTGAVEMTVRDFDSDVVAKLREIAAGRWSYRTRLTKAAYRKGVDAGLADEANNAPYKGGGNWARGENDPRDAWQRGWCDGQRIRAICTGSDTNITHREWKVLPVELQKKIDKEATESHGISFEQAERRQAL